MPLLFDTTVLSLTVYKTMAVVRGGSAGNVVKTFVRDGVLYYRSVSTHLIDGMND